MNTSDKPKQTCKACGKIVAHGYHGPVPHHCAKHNKVCSLGQAGARAVTAHERATKWCKDCTVRNRGLEAARYFGAEAEANPGLKLSDYLEGIADYFGKSGFGALSPDEKREATMAFHAGREDERRARRS